MEDWKDGSPPCLTQNFDGRYRSGDAVPRSRGTSKDPNSRHKLCLDQTKLPSPSAAPRDRTPSRFFFESDGRGMRERQPYCTGKQSRSFANETGPEKLLRISDRVRSSVPRVRSIRRDNTSCLSLAHFDQFWALENPRIFVH